VLLEQLAWRGASPHIRQYLFQSACFTRRTVAGVPPTFVRVLILIYMIVAPAFRIPIEARRAVRVGAAASMRCRTYPTDCPAD
jgi:hypothetical protein